MSLIQEALKRQQDEAEQTDKSVRREVPPVAPAPSPPALPTKASAPPPLPAAAPATEPVEPRTRVGLHITGVVLVVILLLGIGVWLATTAYSRWTLSRQQAGLEQPPTEAPSTEGDAPQTAVPPPPPDENTPVTTAAPEAEEPDHQLPGSGKGGFLDRLAEKLQKAAPASPAGSAGPERDTSDPTASRPDRAPPKPPLPMDWPDLMLNGVVGRGEKGTAVINRKIVSVGESIEGVKLVSLGPQGAELEYRGEKMFLNVGNRTR